MKYGCRCRIGMLGIHRVQVGKMSERTSENQKDADGSFASQDLETNTRCFLEATRRSTTTTRTRTGPTERISSPRRTLDPRRSGQQSRLSLALNILTTNSKRCTRNPSSTRPAVYWQEVCVMAWNVCLFSKSSYFRSPSCSFWLQQPFLSASVPSL